MFSEKFKQIAIRIIVGLILLVFLAQLMFAAEPVVKLPQMPSKTELEPYEDNEDLYAMLLLDYFQMAAMLDAQLKYWQVQPVVVIPTPTYEEISSQEVSTLKKFYNIGLKLQKQIEALPEEKVHASLFDLQKRLQEERSKNIDLSIKNFELSLKSQSTDTYMARINDIIKYCDSLKTNLDSISYQYYMMKYSNENARLKALEANYQPILMLSNSGNLISMSSDAVQTDLSFGAKVELNLHSLTEYGKYFDLYFSYLMPQIKTNPFPENDKSEWTSWNSNIYSFGVNLNLPNIVELKPLSAGIKIGAGHYWGSSSTPNLVLPETKFKGEQMNLELNFSKFTMLNPMSIYFNFSVLFPSENMIYSSQVQAINLGNTTIKNFTFGLRFNIL